MTTVAKIYEYDLEPPKNAVVHKILWLINDGEKLEPVSTGLLEQRLPDWRDKANAGIPKYFVQQSQTLFYLAPMPATTKVESVLLRAVLKPTADALLLDDEIINNHKDAIVNGALFRLLRTPAKVWTDYQAAQMYAALYAEGVKEAEDKARASNTPIARSVKYGGYHTSQTRRRYS